MDNRAKVREFLISRRATITPQQAGLPVLGTRRVPGLRRGEAATLAGVSVEYDAKLERGSSGGASPAVLDPIARAGEPPASGRPDLLATNHLGRAMHSSLNERSPGGPPNFARYTFLDVDAHRFYPSWDTAADTAVAILRAEAGRDRQRLILRGPAEGPLARSAGQD